MAFAPDRSRTFSAHATGAESTRWSSRRIAVCALFVALTLVLSFVEIPILPIAPYLKYDPSGIVSLVAGLAFGPGVGVVVATLPWLLHLFVEPFGAIMALFCSVCTVLPAALLYQAKPTRAGLIIALVFSGIVAIVAAIIGNIVITPLYNPEMSMTDVVALILPVLVPFNLVKVAINAIAAFFATPPIKTLAKSWD